MKDFSEEALKLTILGVHCFQWISDIIVMGISAYFINKYDRGQHITFDIVIENCLLRSSDRYITGFILAAEDYNWLACSYNAPRYASCSKKRGMEAFLFFGFFFSLVGAIFETLRVYQRKSTGASTYVPNPAPAPAPVSVPAPSAIPDPHAKENV
ncbi:hypothetical protein KEM54_003751 [Ascosphaera aggregata]|nr:hypothetical protein KEM54_003751 [Ascosphaera aggregata]